MADWELRQEADALIEKLQLAVGDTDEFDPEDWAFIALMDRGDAVHQDELTLLKRMVEKYAPQNPRF